MEFVVHVDSQFAMYFVDYSGYVGSGLFRKNIQLVEIVTNSIVSSYYKRFVSETVQRWGLLKHRSLISP